MADKQKSFPTTGKIYFQIPLRLETPVMIGTGESENSDIDVIREPVSEKPLIPATSIIGVFRAYLYCSLEGRWSSELEKNLIYLFGDPETEIAQSALQCEDKILENAKISIRDGVKIKLETNTAERGSKFNYELVECPESFDLNLEVTLREIEESPVSYKSETMKKLIATLIRGVHDGHIRLGAKTNKGFGRLAVDTRKKVQIDELDFKTPQDVWRWLANQRQYKDFAEMDRAFAPARRKVFKIDASFQLKSALLIKSYSQEPADPDAISIRRQNGQPVLPGTSTMGAIRHRAFKILHTLTQDGRKSQKYIDALFGFVREKDEEAEASADGRTKEMLAQKGRVRIEEKYIQNVANEVQTRIKIDRFTGGTIHGALFEMMALWQKNSGDSIHIVLTVHDHHKVPWAPGLLLYVLKDLWTGDLAIGGEKNVGRGVLCGSRANISWEDGDVELQANAEGNLVYEKESFQSLEKFATTFKKEMGR